MRHSTEVLYHECSVGTTLLALLTLLPLLKFSQYSHLICDTFQTHCGATIPRIMKGDFEDIIFSFLAGLWIGSVRQRKCMCVCVQKREGEREREICNSKYIWKRGYSCFFLPPSKQAHLFTECWHHKPVNFESGFWGCICFPPPFFSFKKQAHLWTECWRRNPRGVVC